MKKPLKALATDFCELPRRRRGACLIALSHTPHLSGAKVMFFLLHWSEADPTHYWAPGSVDGGRIDRRS